MPKYTAKDAARPLVEAVPTAVEAPALPEARDQPGNEPAGPARPKFAPASTTEQGGRKMEFRRIPVPQHRLTPLRNSWMALYTPVTDNMQLDMRMNLKTKKVEIKTKPDTPDIGNLQKAADFVHAFILGFETVDAIALLRLDDLYVECFEIKDVKTLRGEHLARCIGRLAGKGGKTKFTIENATKTRVVLADSKVNILGAYKNIKACRDAICSLILGSPAGKVYSRMRSTCARLNDI